MVPQWMLINALMGKWKMKFFIISHNPSLIFLAEAYLNLIQCLLLLNDRIGTLKDFGILRLISLFYPRKHQLFLFQENGILLQNYLKNPNFLISDIQA